MVNKQNNISFFLKIKVFFVFTFIFYLLSFTFSQDIHFSQYYASPLTMNPANTGNFNGDWRFCNSYRNQWRSLSKPFITIAPSFERRFNLYGNKFTLGALIVSDKSGNVNLVANKIMASATYEKSFNGGTFLLGGQFGFVNRTFSLNNLTFPSQYDRSIGQFNYELANEETNLNNNTLYPDVNVGAIWRNDWMKIKPELGIAFFHVNKPNAAFFTDSDKMPIRQVVHAGIAYPVFPKIIISPKIFYMSQHKATDLLLGSTIDFLMNDNKIKLQSIFGGMYLRDGYKRNTDAFFVVGGVKIHDFTIGLSYDINISEMHVATQYRGAFEISLIYTSLSTFIKKIAIPCDIY